MSYKEQLEELIDEKDGLIRTKDVEYSGIPRQYLSIFVNEDKLERVAQGIYLSPESFDDEMYRLQASSQRAIFSHETALYVHDLTDRDPLEWSVTVPYGYNATHLREKGIQVYSIKKELYTLGVTEIKTIYGRTVKAYNKERTICDLVRNRKQMDVAVLNEAIKCYLDLREKNIPLLLSYAKKMNVETVLRNYLEILL